MTNGDIKVSHLLSSILRKVPFIKNIVWFSIVTH